MVTVRHTLYYGTGYKPGCIQPLVEDAQEECPLSPEPLNEGRFQEVRDSKRALPLLTFMDLRTPPLETLLEQGFHAYVSLYLYTDVEREREKEGESNKGYIYNNEDICLWRIRMCPDELESCQAV